MGTSCSREDVQMTKARIVSSLGVRERKPVAYDEEARRPKHVIECPDGHVMKGWVVREMFAVCAVTPICAECGEDCSTEHSCYRCKICQVYYCNDCSREKLGLPRTSGSDILDVMPGDIFLAGPDHFGIHHVILVRSGWLETDPEVFEAMNLEPGTQLLSVRTIESTQGSVGDETWWYPATTFFIRDPRDGRIRLVADLKEDSSEIEQAMEPVPTKVLLHPLRGDGEDEDEEHLNLETFEHVIATRASESKQYGKLTAVRSVISGILQDEVIHAGKYPTAKDKKALHKQIVKSWKSRPICASVAVQCWQEYFLQEHPISSGTEGVDKILEYMPHWCHKSTPSAMVKELTQRGWVLCDSMDS